MGFPPLDEPTRDRLIGRFGPAVAAWLDAVPAQVTALAARWGVVLGSPPAVDGGRTSVVVHGLAADGAAVVLKLTPEPALAVAEGDVLATASAGGGGVVDGAAGGGAASAAAPPLPRLIARDDAAGALLIEAIEPGTPLDRRHEPPDPTAVGALLRGLRALVRGRPSAAAVPGYPEARLAAWCSALAAMDAVSLAARPGEVPRRAERLATLRALAA